MLFSILITCCFTVFILGLLLGMKLKSKKYPPEYRRTMPPAASYAQAPSFRSEESLKMEKELKQRGEADFVFKLHEQLSSTLENDRIARYIVDSLKEFLFVEKVILLLVDKDTDLFRVEYSYGARRESVSEFLLSKSESVAGFITSQRKPLLVQDIEQEYYLKKLNKEGYLTKSFIGAPLIFKNEVFGVLYVCDKKPNKQFSQIDFSLVVNVAKVSAIAFQNVKLNAEIENDYVKTLSTLALAIDARDPYTQRHSVNVTKYTVAIAIEMGCSRDQIQLFKRASSLHDIGKIGIRDAILLKPGKLTDDEFDQIKTHPVRGEEMVKPLSFLKEASCLIRHHHERYDGRGYPDRLAADEIELGSRILCVADTFDAMTGDRPYRKALSFSVAKEELIKCKGSQFDPEAVDAFLIALERDVTLFTEQVM